MEWINGTIVRNQVLVSKIVSMLRAMPGNEPMNDWKGESKVTMYRIQGYCIVPVHAEAAPQEGVENAKRRALDGRYGMPPLCNGKQHVPLVHCVARQVREHHQCRIK